MRCDVGVRTDCLEAVRVPGDVSLGFHHRCCLGHDDARRHCSALSRDSASLRKVRLSRRRAARLAESVLRRRDHLPRLVHIRTRHPVHLVSVQAGVLSRLQDARRRHCADTVLRDAVQYVGGWPLQRR